MKLTDQALAASRQPARCYLDVSVRNTGVGGSARAKDSSMLVRGFDRSRVDEEDEQQRRNRARPGRPAAMHLERVLSGRHFSVRARVRGCNIGAPGRGVKPFPDSPPGLIH